MPFSKDGFLGDEAASWTAKHRNEHQDYFEILETANRAAHALLAKKPGLTQPTQMQLTVLGLYLRVLGSLAAIGRLLEFGMGQEAGIVLRTLLETTFFICRAVGSKEWLDNYLASAFFFDRRYINANFSQGPRLNQLDLETQRVVAEKRKELDRIIEEKAVTESKIFDAARDSGLMDIYNSGWRWFSTESAHPSANSIDHFFVRENNKIVAIQYGPNLKHIDLAVYTAATAVISAMMAFGLAYDLGQTDADSLDAEIRKLFLSIRSKVSPEDGTDKTGD